MKKQMLVVRVVALVIAMTVAGAGNGFAAANRWWDGSTSVNWSDGTNWSGGVVPGAGDAAIIMKGSFINSPTVDVAATVGGIEINTQGGVVTLTLNADLTIAAGGLINHSLGASAATITGGQGIICAGALTIQNGVAGSLFSFTCADITGNGANLLTFAGDITVSANILDGVGTPVIKAGAGTLILSGNNTYTGVTTVTAGTLSVATIGDGGVAGNLGAAAAAAANLVLDGGTLQYTGAIASTNRNFTLIAAKTSTIDVTTNTLMIYGASTNTTGALTKIGAGTLRLLGTNLHTGVTTVTAGILLYGAANALATGDVTVNGGTLDIVTHTDAVGVVTLTSGFITGVGAGVLTGTSYVVQSGTVSAILAGAGVTLTKNTAGTVTLSGANTYSGTTTISGGTLLYNVAMGGACLGAVTVASGATLGGKDGTVKGAVSVLSGGIVKPGDPATAAGIGTLNCASTVDFANGAILNVDVSDPNKDVLAVTGAMTVGDTAVLQMGTNTGVSGNTYNVATSVAGGITAFSPSLPAGWTQNVTATLISLTYTAAPPVIPTLNEWGLIILFLSIAAYAVLFIKKRYETV